jgi:hypothetical protein
MWTTVLLASMLGNAEAKKQKDGEGVLIEIVVLDGESANPISTAVVKHEKEADSSRVNQLSGKWQAREVFDSDGEEYLFLANQTEQFSISAPGYMTQLIQYDVRRRRNNIEIRLQKMEIDTDTIEPPLIPFGRDQEREGGGPGGAN